MFLQEISNKTLKELTVFAEKKKSSSQGNKNSSSSSKYRACLTGFQVILKMHDKAESCTKLWHCTNSKEKNTRPAFTLAEYLTRIHRNQLTSLRQCLWSSEKFATWTYIIKVSVCVCKRSLFSVIVGKTKLPCLSYQYSQAFAKLLF